MHRPGRGAVIQEVGKVPAVDVGTCAELCNIVLTCAAGSDCHPTAQCKSDARLVVDQTAWL